VFIRPTIIRDGVSMNKLSFNKYNFIRGEQFKQKEDGIELMPMTDTPILPEWNDELVLPPTYEESLRKQNAQERKDD
jgi:general secretion pathway protein D